ncbi:YafY family transcriptional regulator [Hylemonella gracilis]|jgi:predicted DNA-binding transcriptional regulator YafY|uniref:YafY family transcriptional regulator n=1 Tax=Hylemonella gracilis TaxID=80880 RepID=A0A4P6UGP8_9BURK|nr:YafY family protein [Hylemonella gracilis]QBK03576.1 YafY family transcriptional regulator [Hylemonella gracilis]
MSRTERLLTLMEQLRRHRHPVSGGELAGRLGVSLRTLYRDIATLQSQGARIEGEAGVGYVLRPGFTLPPLMFTDDEIEALVLGMRWVSDRADAHLADAARHALSRISAVLPPDLRYTLESSALLVAPRQTLAGSAEVLAQTRTAMREERRVELRYMDAQERETLRIVWPCALAFFEQVSVLVAWCETRQGFRHFRTDRIRGLNLLEARYPRRRLDLLREWRLNEGIAPPSL